MGRGRGEESEGGGEREGGEGGRGGMTVIHILIGMFNSKLGVRDGGSVDPPIRADI